VTGNYDQMSSDPVTSKAMTTNRGL